MLYSPLHSGPFYGKEVRLMETVVTFVLDCCALNLYEPLLIV